MQKSEGKAKSTGDPVSFVEWLVRPKQQRYKCQSTSSGISSMYVGNESVDVATEKQNAND